MVAHGGWASQVMELGMKMVLRLVVAILILMGGRHLWRKTPASEKSLLVSMIVFIGGWTILHTLWNGVSGRYFWPTIPFLICFFVAGLWRVCQSNSWAWVLATSFLLLTYGLGNQRLWEVTVIESEMKQVFKG